MMIDSHTHILPGIDDGSKNAEMSVEMLRQQGKQGVKAVVLTPHFYRSTEHLNQFLNRREQACRILEQALIDLPDCDEIPTLYLGSEVAWAPDMLDWEEISQVCIGGSRFMLLEMPFTTWGDHTIHLIYDLMRRRGITPIIAHLERYIKAQDPVYIQEILSMGVPVQVSADPLLHPLKGRTVLKMLRTGEAQLLASDCHNLDRRPPNLARGVEVIERKLGHEVVRMMEDQTMQILHNAAQLFSWQASPFRNQ